MENAIAILIDRGRPSGTATIMIAIAMEKKSRSFRRVSFERSFESVKRSLQTRKRAIAQKETKPAVYPHLLN